MSLPAGTRIGSFEVIGVLGAGGMGEVHRARDLKLGRDVALKLLPRALRSDPNRLARLVREARALAALNHPNIATIHGIEDLEGSHALVLELVDGEPLSHRLRRGPLPVGEALAIARQIAAALEAAHAKDIVHRDLKPANVVLAPDGVAKVLDFGLAKIVEEDRSAADGTDLPTITATNTREGLVVGTAAYMSPEQARGRRVDKRTDLWSFGCLLFEMLAGRRAFSGETRGDVMAAVLEHEPDWLALPPATPAPVRRLLRRTLAKDPRERLRDAGDARLELESHVEDVAAAPASSPRLRLVGLGAALVAGAGLGWLAAGTFARGDAPAAPSMSVFVETLPEGRVFEGGNAGTGSMVALSPDGGTLVYVAEDAGQPRLFVRPLGRIDQLRATAIPEQGAREPFFSPDGEWLGFRVGQTLMRRSLRGGLLETIAVLPGGTASVHGVSWNADGSLLVGAGLNGLVRVRAGGSLDTLAAPAKDRNMMYPQALPGGRVVLYTEISASAPSGELRFYDIASGTSSALRRGSAGRYLASGHLVFVASGTLWVVPFDVARLRMDGTPVPAITGVRENPDLGAPQVTLTDSGALAYLPATVSARTLVWLDRGGRETAVGAPPRAYAFPRVSPDGTRIAVSMKEQGQDIHVWEIRTRRAAPTDVRSRAEYLDDLADTQSPGVLAAGLRLGTGLRAAG